MAPLGMPMLIDTHCHLDFPDFAEDRSAVIARAREAGVGRMVSISTHISRFAQVHKLAQEYEEVFCTLGTHPHHCAEAGELPEVDWLVRESSHPKIVGLGETGLDYFYDTSPRDVQAESFRRHIRACLTTDLPIIIHARDADADVHEILKSEGQGKLRGIMHCFSSSRLLAEQALALGLYISISGMVTFKKLEELRAIVRDVPLDRLLVETDSPYLAPMPHRGKTNEPAYVVHTAAMVAGLKAVSLDELAEATTANALRVFSRMTASQ